MNVSGLSRPTSDVFTSPVFETWHFFGPPDGLLKSCVHPDGKSESRGTIACACFRSAALKMG